MESTDAYIQDEYATDSVPGTVHSGMHRTEYCSLFGLDAVRFPLGFRKNLLSEWVGR